MSNKKEVDPIREANIKFVIASSMSAKSKKKTLAFLNCEPIELAKFCKGIPNVPPKYRKEYDEEDYDNNGNKLK